LSSKLAAAVPRRRRSRHCPRISEETSAKRKPPRRRPSTT
jgi:hypothetical protein